MSSTFLQRGARAVTKLLAVGTVATFAVPFFSFTVLPGHRGVVFDRLGGKGLREETYREGIHFKLPWFHEPTLLDVRTTPTEIPTMTGAKDLQLVSINLRILSRPNINKLREIMNDLGPNYNDRILPSLSNEVLKAVVAQYPAEQLITQREAISREVREALAVRTEHFNIILDDVSLVHVGFSPDFAKAIEDKQVAEQTAERARYIVDRADQERQAAVIRASAEAEAAELLGRAVARAGNGAIELRRLSTAVEVVELLADKPNVTYLPADANPLLMIQGNHHNKNQKM